MPSGKPGSGMKYGDNCKDCGYPIFEDNAVTKGKYLQTRCKTCYRIYSDNLPSRSKEARRYQYVAWKFGLSPEEYERKVELQLGGCAICKQPCNVRASLAVDHDHKTGAIRDLLCHRCNMVLGAVNDNELLLLEMMDYLKRHVRKSA